MSLQKKNSKQENNYVLEEALKQFENLKVPAKYSKESSWKKLETTIESKDKWTSQKKRSLNFYYIASAAVLMLLVGLSLLKYINTNVCISSKNGEKVLVYLPDSSSVELNAASTITYNRFGWKHNRLVSLAGEGFFNVKKGKRFEVKTNQGNVVVIGTSFNVFARNKAFSVVCKTGKVKVQSINAVILAPGMKAAKNKNQMLKTETAIVEHETAWQNGEFWFNGALLSDVFKEIERQFDITIVINGLNERRYTGYFNNKSLQNALTAVCSPMQVNFKKVNDKTYIIY